MSALDEGTLVRLGSAAWCGAEAEAAAVAALARRVADRLQPARAPRRLRHPPGLAPGRARRSSPNSRRDREVEILSGDREAAVALTARELGVARYAAGLKPADKIARLEALKQAGRRPLMIGDGLNDAPALAAAYVSISPISAAHVAQAQADALFLGERLQPVADALRISAKARRLMIAESRDFGDRIISSPCRSPCSAMRPR